MRQFKLVKSVGYVTYPMYQELLKISKSVTTFRDTLFSSVIAALFNTTPASKYIIGRCRAKNFDGVLGKILNYEHASLFLAICVAMILVGIISLCRFLHSTFGSSNSTKAKRDIIVDKFYHVAIPQWVEVSSILEQVHEIDCDGSSEELVKRQKLLLLLQAKHEICEVHDLIRSLKIKQYKPALRGNAQKQNLQDNLRKAENSKILLDRIGECTYDELVTAIFESLCEIYSELKFYGQKTETDIERIQSILGAPGPFDTVNSLKCALCQKREELRSDQSPNATPA